MKHSYAVSITQTWGSMVSRIWFEKMKLTVLILLCSLLIIEGSVKVEETTQKDEFEVLKMFPENDRVVKKRKGKKDLYSRGPSLTNGY